MGVPAERLLHLQRQSVHAAPHIGAADRQPDPHARGYRDHRRSSTSSTSRSAEALTPWRKRYRSGPTEPTGLQLMPVTVTPDRPIASAAARANEQIAIELVGGYRVRIGNRVKASAL